MTASAADIAKQFDEQGARKTEALYLTPDVVAQRARVLEVLALQPGERVADLGCGPGLLALDMGKQVGADGSVDGIDFSTSMIPLAQRRCADLPWVRLRSGDVGQLPYADGAFDAAVCTQVYEYVADIEGALRELRRVLRPGGRALVMDTDWESCVWNSSDDARMRRVIEIWNTHCPHPHLPRRLGRLLAAAGPGSDPHRSDSAAEHALRSRYVQRRGPRGDQGLHAQAGRRGRGGRMGGGSARARVTRRILLQPEPLSVLARA